MPTIQSSNNLTKTELALVKQLCLSNQDIAKRMGIDVMAVKMRIWRLYAKFGVDNRVSMVVKALRLGFISINDLEYRDHNV